MKRVLAILILFCFLCGCGAKMSDSEPTLIQTEPLKTSEDTTTTKTPETTSTISATTVPETSECTRPPVIALAEEVLSRLTTEELVGQLFLARCPDIQAVEDVQRYHLGGYLLFGRDFEEQTPASIQQRIADYQAAASVPMLIAVDEEGGTVTRVSGKAAFRQEEFQPPRALYSQGGKDLLVETEREKCRFLRNLGINVNMAPVCDVTTDPNAFMYDRSLGQDPKETGECIRAVVQAMSEENVGSVLKHFPGYGNNADTHTGIAVDDRSMQELNDRDLVPFRAGIQAKCGAILVSHTIVNALDSQMPASLSPAVNQFLRQDMEFNGVILTDDLCMQAISDAYGAEEAAVLAILAGNDLLCSSDYAVQYQAVLQAVQDGRISLEQIKASVLRVLRWKGTLGLLT